MKKINLRSLLMQGYKPIKIKKQYKQEYKWTKKLNKEMFSRQIEFKM